MGVWCILYYHSYDDDVFIVTTSLWGFEEKRGKKKTDKPNISHPPHGKGNIVFQTFGWERLDVTRMEKHHGHHKVRGNKIPHGGKLTLLLAPYSVWIPSPISPNWISKESLSEDWELLVASHVFPFQTRSFHVGNLTFNGFFYQKQIQKALVFPTKNLPYIQNIPLGLNLTDSPDEKIFVLDPTLHRFRNVRTVFSLNSLHWLPKVVSTKQHLTNDWRDQVPRSISCFSRMH